MYIPCASGDKKKQKELDKWVGKKVEVEVVVKKI